MVLRAISIITMSAAIVSANISISRAADGADAPHTVETVRVLSGPISL